MTEEIRMRYKLAFFEYTTFLETVYYYWKQYFNDMIDIFAKNFNNYPRFNRT